MRQARSHHRFNWLDRPVVVVLIIALLLLAYVGGVVVIWKIWDSGNDDAFQPMQEIGAYGLHAASAFHLVRGGNGSLDT